MAAIFREVCASFSTSSEITSSTLTSEVLPKNTSSDTGSAASESLSVSISSLISCISSVSCLTAAGVSGPEAAGSSSAGISDAVTSWISAASAASASSSTSCVSFCTAFSRSSAWDDTPRNSFMLSASSFCRLMVLYWLTSTVLTSISSRLLPGSSWVGSVSTFCSLLNSSSSSSSAAACPASSWMAFPSVTISASIMPPVCFICSYFASCSSVRGWCSFFSSSAFRTYLPSENQRNISSHSSTHLDSSPTLW